MTNPKSEFIGIRITRGQKQRIQKKWHGTLSAYIRMLIDRDLKGNRFLKVFGRR